MDTPATTDTRSLTTALAAARAHPGAALSLGRSASSVAATLRDDASAWTYRWIWRPMLAVQLVLYVRVMVRLLAHPTYASPDPSDPLLRENHIGNLVALVSQPHFAMLSVHML